MCFTNKNTPIKLMHSKNKNFVVPSSVVELVLPHQIASLMRGGAKAGP